MKFLLIYLLAAFFHSAVNGVGFGGSVPAVNAGQVFSPSVPAVNTQAVGTVTATNSPTSWSITAGDPSGDFAISNAGAITFTAQGATDYNLGCTSPATCAKSATLTVQATNGSGSGSGTVTVNAYADGSVGAPSGTAQLPTILNGYSKAPSWKAAGVNYYVGIASGTVLTDWQSMSVTGITVSANHVSCNAGAGSVTVNAIDFSLHGGAYILNPSGGCTSLTITNSQFGCSTTFSNILDQNAATLSVRQNNFDGSACSSVGNPNMNEWIATAGTATVRYNFFKNGPGETLNLSGSASADYRYNLMNNVIPLNGTHMNYMQWTGTGTSPSLLVAYNTTYQTSCVGAEGFQVYGNTQQTYTNPTLIYNAMIAVFPGTNACPSPNNNVVMSYMMHGNDATSSTITGQGINQNNYFDISGAYGAYYPGTMKNADWTSLGNYNMTTGATITPQ